MCQTIRFQIWRMHGLRLLFRQSSVMQYVVIYASIALTIIQVYGDESLIQKFDSDAQEQIRSDLDDLLVIIERILKLLKRISTATTTNDSKKSDSMSYSNELTTLSEPTPGRSKSPLGLLKWTFRDKKDLTNLLGKFTDANNRLSEMIRFWSLASDIGMNLGHLQYLRSDEDAVTLGCSDNASLALAVSDTEHNSESFELNSSFHDALRDSKKIEDRFAVFAQNGEHLLRENCVYIPRKDDGIDPQSRRRINALAELLHQPKEQFFCILACQGWKYLPESQCISYIFRIPSNVIPEPLSLLRMLNDRSVQPSLEIKFHLAHNLARCIAQLHMVKWTSSKALPESLVATNLLRDRSMRAFVAKTSCSFHKRPPQISQQSKHLPKTLLT